MKTIAIVVLLLSVSLTASAGVDTYGVFAGSYSSGKVDQCTGNCDTDTRKDGGDAMLGVGVQYGYLAAEVNGYMAGQGLGAALIARTPLHQTHTLGAGIGLMRVSYDAELAPDVSKASAGNAAVAFLEYTVRVATMSDRELRILVRAGWQDATLKAKFKFSTGTTVYQSEIEESGPFGQVGILFRTK